MQSSRIQTVNYRINFPSHFGGGSPNTKGVYYTQGLYGAFRKCINREHSQNMFNLMVNVIAGADGRYAIIKPCASSHNGSLTLDAGWAAAAAAVRFVYNAHQRLYGGAERMNAPKPLAKHKLLTTYEIKLYIFVVASDITAR